MKSRGEFERNDDEILLESYGEGTYFGKVGGCVEGSVKGGKMPVGGKGF